MRTWHGDVIGRQQRQWRGGGQATMAETEAMVGAYNNPPKSGSNIGRNIVMLINPQMR